MDDLEQLELLSLVSKITSELHNHVGIADKGLAEFIIHNRTECTDTEQFKARLDEIGADFPPSLVDSIDRLVLAMHPKYKKKVVQSGDLGTKSNGQKDEKSRVFRGLAVPNKAVDFEDEEDTRDSTFAVLESMAPSKSHTSGRKRSCSPDR